MNITYSEKYLAESFAGKIISNIDNKDFMDARNSQRSEQKVFEDNVKGKIAEIAVSNFIYQTTGFMPEMDFNVYGLGVGDDFDVIVRSLSIDVKASSSRAKTIMVEDKKMRGWDARKHPDYLCMVAVEGMRAEYLFGIPYIEFKDKSKLFKRGECIPNTNVKLKADNYIICKDECYQHMHLAEFINQ